MRKIFLLAVGALALLPAESRPLRAAAAAPQASPVAASPQRALLDRYCVTCHNDRLKVAELSLDTVERIDVDQLLPADYGGEFLLDLENVEFIDSIGLRTVLEMKNRLAEPSRHRIKVKKGKVKSMIAQTGLDEELNVEAR